MRNLTPQERHDIALTIAGEIDPRFSPYGTESTRKEIASILGVIENRGALKNKSLSDIVHERAQFSTWNTKKDRATARAHYSKHAAEIDKAVDDYFGGYLRSPVPYATQYFSPKGMKNKTEPKWAKALATTTRVGPHVFGYFKHEPEKLAVAQLAGSLPFKSAGTAALFGGLPAAAGIGGLSLLSLGKDVASSSIRGAIGAARDRLARTYGDLADTMGPLGMLGLDGRLVEPSTTRSVSQPGRLPHTVPTPMARPPGPGLAALTPHGLPEVTDRITYAHPERGLWSKGLTPAATATIGSMAVMNPGGIGITSATRTKLQNDNASNARASQHLTGNAFDLDLQGLSNEARSLRVQQARALGATRLGSYDDKPDMLHVDFASGYPPTQGGVYAMHNTTRHQAARVPGWMKAGLAADINNVSHQAIAATMAPLGMLGLDGRMPAQQPAHQPPATNSALGGEAVSARGVPSPGPTGAFLQGTNRPSLLEPSVPVADTRREAILAAREARPAPSAQAQPYASEAAPSRALGAIEQVAPRSQPTIAAPQGSLPAARPDMRNAFAPAPAPTPMDALKAELGPALRRAIIGGLVGGLPGAAIGLAGGLLGARTGGLGALGPGFDAAVPSGERFSTGSGLGGILSAMGGPRGATGYSRSNPGMSYTSLGPGMGGLRRSDRYGWTETVGPGGEVRGISYDNGGGGLLGGLSRGLGSLFGGSGSGKSNGNDGKGKRGGAVGGYSGNGLY